jgi:hypothetical protein
LKWSPEEVDEILRCAGLGKSRPEFTTILFGRRFTRAFTARICLALLFAFPHFVENFVENLAEFDGLFSNMTRVDKVRDEVSDEERKVNNTLNTYFSPDCGTAIRTSEFGLSKRALPRA